MSLNEDSNQALDETVAPTNTLISAWQDAKQI